MAGDERMGSCTARAGTMKYWLNALSFWAAVKTPGFHERKTGHSWSKISCPLPPSGSFLAHTANPRLQLQQTLSSASVPSNSAWSVCQNAVEKELSQGKKCSVSGTIGEPVFFGLCLPSLDTYKVQSPSWHAVGARELIFLDRVIQKQELKQWRLWPPVPQKVRGSINFQRWE